MKDPDPYARDVLEDWAKGFEDRDGKFVQEFQTTFNSSFWELYLFAVLKQFQYGVDFSFNRPDFVVPDAPQNFCIEASSSHHAQKASPEWERLNAMDQLKELDRYDIVDSATVRLAGTLRSKHQKFLDSYSELDHVKDRPFILAIAPFDQPFFYFQNDTAMQRVLYAYEKPIYRDFPEENRREIYGHEHIDWILNPNGAQVPLGAFSKGLMPEISAVLFSNVATFGKVRALSSDPGQILFEFLRFNEHGLRPTHGALPKAQYVESLLDGLHIFHNPTARYPLDSDLFDHPDITHHWYSLSAGMPLTRAKDGALFQRMVIKMQAAKGDG
ncbi:MAG TPA: hypothetical protein VI279_16985 [Rhodocyclaceae bacterium]